MTAFTSIAGHEVPLWIGDVPTIHFSGGPGGPYDIGDFQFWLALTDEGNGVVARCHAGDDPGDRFRRMEHDPNDASAWLVASNATSLRPAPPVAVSAWLDAHPDEAKFAAHTCRIGPKVLAIKKHPSGFRLE